MKRLEIFGLGAVALVVLLLLVTLCSLMRGVEAGEVGVEETFGAMRTHETGGPRLVSPFAKITRLSTKTTKNDEEATVPTKGGLSVNLHAILLYRLKPEAAVTVLGTVGAKYEETVIDPIFRNIVRDVCAEHTPEDLYTSARTEVEQQIFARASRDLEARGFVCEAVMIQDPKMPQVVTERIQAKIGAEQDAIRMQSVYKQREQEAMAKKRQTELEAESKVIEAEGIAKAQKIIQQDLTENYLRYLAVEQMRDAAKYGNSTYYFLSTDGHGPLLTRALEKKAEPGK